ncbi:hypothetical protein [Streptomyces varsoviensis]|uniref:hypothetical protein n=1 Tax=Streptomyces varsoviensis TaxID=67373 RepID=UPI0037A8C2CF
MVGELRRTAVLVPTVPAEPGMSGASGGPDAPGEDGLLSVDFGGIRWICAFTDEAALARFAATRGGNGSGAGNASGGTDASSTDWEYRTVLGARLLDVVVPAVGVPAGVALDVGSEHPMMFPPVVGIVPDAVAVDAPENWRPAAPEAPRSAEGPGGTAGPQGPNGTDGPAGPENYSPEAPR